MYVYLLISTQKEPAVFGRVCRKLNIDVAKAVTGFDGKKGFAITDGYIICKEFEVSLANKKTP